MTEKCSAALAEVAAAEEARSRALANSVPAPRKTAPAPVPAKSVPAPAKKPSVPANPVPARAEKKTAPSTPHAFAEDDFAQQYANFDEASVAPAETAVPAETAAPSARVSRESGARSATAEEVRASVPEALRTLVGESFRAAFTRYVPASDVRIFSRHGEISSEKTDVPAEDSDADSEASGEPGED